MRVRMILLRIGACACRCLPCGSAGGQRWWRERVVKHGVLHSGTIMPDPRSGARTSLFLEADGPAVVSSDSVIVGVSSKAEG